MYRDDQYLYPFKVFGLFHQNLANHHIFRINEEYKIGMYC